MPDSLISRNCRPELFLRSNQKFDCERIPISELGSSSRHQYLDRNGDPERRSDGGCCTPDRETGMQFVPQKEGKRKKSGYPHRQAAPDFSTSIQNRQRKEVPEEQETESHVEKGNQSCDVIMNAKSKAGLHPLSRRWPRTARGSRGQQMLPRNRNDCFSAGDERTGCVCSSRLVSSSHTLTQESHWQ